MLVIYDNKGNKIELPGWAIVCHNGEKYLRKGQKRITLDIDLMRVPLDISSAELENIRAKIEGMEE